MPPLDPVAVGIDDIKKLVADGLDENHAINKKFLDGDHWQGGSGWVGPLPPASAEGAQLVIDEIRRAFVSKNVLAEVVQRHVAGVVGREPTWTLVPRRALQADEELSDAEKNDISEGNAMLTDWWDKRNAHGVISQVVENVLYSKRGVLRLFVPPSKLQPTGPDSTTGVIIADDPLQAMLLIYPEAPLPEQATVYIDPDTKDEVALLAVEKDNKVSAEVVFLRSVDAAAAAGATLDPNGAPTTAIRTVSETGDTTVDIPLGGRLTMMEIRRRPLITEQMRQAQKSLNLALSMVPRNVVTGGYLERIIINGQMPGEWKEDSEGNEYFVPKPFETGAGVTTFLAGVTTEDEASGASNITTPQVYERDPVPVTSSVEAKSTHYEDILDEAGQRHVLMGADAEASGYSREQARADFEETLKVTLMLVVPLGRWLLETALAMTEAFTNQIGKWTQNYRVEFRPYVNTGPLSSDEIRVDNERVEAGTLSLESAMQRAGIVDIDAELGRINEQPDAQLAVLERQVNVVQILFNLGMSFEAAGELVGMNPDQIAILKKAQADADARIENTEPEPAGAPTGDTGGGTPNAEPPQE